MTKLWVRGGTIVDGTGGPGYCADLVVEGGRIADILRQPDGAEGVTTTPSDATVVDASGLVVAPGFIDIHSHSDFTLIVDPRAVSQITQGVTLEVVGNCGHGCAPIADLTLAKSNIYGIREEHDLNWRTVGEYLDRMAAGRPAVNVLTLVPNGNLRLAVAGLVDRPSTPDEIKQMKRLLAQGMDEGAYGYSTGLEYGPERACLEEEIVDLCRVAAGRGGFYATHTRNRPGEAQETIAEAIRTGAEAGLPLQISHISVVARLAEDGRWAVEQALAQVDAARAQGLDVTFDMHTRLFGTTHLSAALPPWVLDGDKTDIARRLTDRSTRRDLKTYGSIITALARGDWSRIVLFDCPSHPEWSRRSIADLSAAWGTDPFDTIYGVLLGEMDHLHSLMIIAYAYREQDIRAAFEHPLCMVGSDATTLAPDGPLADSAFHGAYTWASWYVRHFVRDTRAFSLEEAVRRLTSLPASRLGLHNRGIIRRQACADLAIFDPALFAECGTDFEPNQTATGMRHVLVNGVMTLKDGSLTGERAGQVLRKG